MAKNAGSKCQKYFVGMSVYRVAQIKKSIRANWAFKGSLPFLVELKSKNVPSTERYYAKGVPDSLRSRFGSQVLAWELGEDQARARFLAHSCKGSYVKVKQASLLKSSFLNWERSWLDLHKVSRHMFFIKMFQNSMMFARFLVLGKSGWLLDAFSPSCKGILMG